MTREPIYSALFNLVKTATGAKVASRVLRDFATLTPEQYPALFMEEKHEAVTVKMPGISPTYKMTVDIGLFVMEAGGSQTVGAETNIPSANLNNLIDAIEAALKPSAATNVQTLGGVCQHAYIEGNIEKFPAVPGRGSAISVAVIPVVILAV